MISCGSCSGFVHEGRKRHGLNYPAMIGHWALPAGSPGKVFITVYPGYETRVLRPDPERDDLHMRYYDHLGEYILENEGRLREDPVLREMADFCFYHVWLLERCLRGGG